MHQAKRYYLLAQHSIGWDRMKHKLYNNEHNRVVILSFNWNNIKMEEVSNKLIKKFIL